MKIFINAGHGGRDCGAIGASGSKERDINAQIAKATAERLKAAGYTVVLYQQQKRLADVAEMANKSKADLFVAIHCNAAGNKNAHGTETWHYTGCPIGSKTAKAIQREVVGTLGTRDRGVKSSRSLYVLRKTVMPAVLCEVGFISNQAEEKLILSKIPEIGKAIADGIIAAQ